MKRTDTGAPYLSFCLIVRHAAATLEATLKSLRARAPQAEIVIVDTCSRDDSGVDVFFPKSEWPKDISDAEVQTRLGGAQLKLLFIDEHAVWATGSTPAVRIRVAGSDGLPIYPSLHEETARRAAKALGLEKWTYAPGESTVEISKRYADVWQEYRGPRGDWCPEMGWFDDAAAARNKSFELASGFWTGWVDADDVIPDGVEAERLLRLNGHWKPKGDEGPQVQSQEKGLPPTLEEILRFVEKNNPATEAVWCPYLYRAEPDGRALEWQDRERFIRNKEGWHWMSKGHEVLVPKNARHVTPPIFLSLLYVHKKRWTNEDAQFSLDRHYAVLLKEYEAGNRDARTCMYLENFSRFKCPERREEFIAAAYNSSTIPVDRVRALISAGNYAAESGFHRDAMENFAAAVHTRPDLPDGHFHGARVLQDVGDWIQAGRWYVNGLKTRPGMVDSFISPRDHVTKFRALAANALRQSAHVLLQQMSYNAVDGVLAEAAQIVEELCKSEALGLDLFEASRLRNLIVNDRDRMLRAREIFTLWDFLVHNDETKRAMELLAVVPHNLQDHPLMIQMERWAVKLRKHLTDPKAYAEFYNDKVATGMVFSEQIAPNPIDPRDPTFERMQFVAAWCNAQNRDLSVIELGSFDGSTGIPLLLKTPSIKKYVAVDACTDALDQLKKRIVKHGLSDRNVVTINSMDLDAAPEHAKSYDAVVFLEVIEHVPDPVASVKNLLRLVKPGGRLFISTPWGAYDQGRPEFFEKRDPRGHVRAMTQRDVVETVEAAGGRVVELHGNIGVAGCGGCLYIEVEALPESQASIVNQTFKKAPPIAFAVAGALWDWNASRVLRDGIGASEEIVVYLARELAAQGRNAEVYGPLPHEVHVDEEVDARVKYWPQAQFRKIRPDSTVVVSRAPFLGDRLDGIVGDKLDKILFLTDTVYDDLNATTAEHYRKIVVLSNWHKQMTHELMGVPLAKMVPIYNFILPEHFKLDGAPKRERHHFVYASSPDRGLLNLLKIWPRILEKWPDATLDVFYGWNGAKKLAATAAPGWIETYRKMRLEYQGLRFQKGVRDVGMVNHVQIAREMQRASVWAYPTTFSETGCSNAKKARAAGCVPVTTPLAALVETAACDQGRFVPVDGPFDEYAARFVSAIAEVIDTPDSERAKMREEALEKFKISTILPQWQRVLDR